MFSSFRTWFWSPSIWLPRGYNWTDLTPNEKVQEYAQFDDLLYPIPLAICIIIVRLLFERFIFYPLGTKLGIKNVPRVNLTPNPVLEEVYKAKSPLLHKDIELLAKKTDLEPRQVERWLRKRTIMDRPTTLAKFSESGWRFFCYSLSPVFGLYILWDKPWFWDINACWIDYPHHGMTNDVWWYYMVGSGFYWSLMLSQFIDNKRKDFWIMFVHHLSTLLLLSFSWICHFSRIGTLVLVLHDCADASLEIAKMTQYAELKKASDILFPFFAIVWVVTRLGIYPGYILNNVLYDQPKIMESFPAMDFMKGILLLLLCLHIFWTWFIVKAVAKAVTNAKIGGDERSSSEELADSDASISTTIKPAEIAISHNGKLMDDSD